MKSIISFLLVILTITLVTVADIAQFGVKRIIEAKAELVMPEAPETNGKKIIQIHEGGKVILLEEKEKIITIDGKKGR